MIILLFSEKITMSWDTEKTIRFIKEYEKRPILWKLDYKGYYDAVKKEEAWEELAAIFGEDTDFLKKKIGSLRGTRRREKSRMIRSRKEGKDNYTTRWFAWESLKFLDAIEKRKSGISNAKDDYDEDDEDQVEEKKYAIPSTASNSTKTIISNNAPKRKHTEDTRSQETVTILQNQTEDKDECSLFGEYIAEKLRAFDSRTRAVLQHQIHNLIFQAEMNENYAEEPTHFLAPETTPNNSHSYSSPSHYSETSPLPSPQEQKPSIETFDEPLEYP